MAIKQWHFTRGIFWVFFMIDWLTLWGFQAFRPLTETNLLWRHFGYFPASCLGNLWRTWRRSKGKNGPWRQDSQSRCKMQQGSWFHGAYRGSLGPFLHVLLNIQLNLNLDRLSCMCLMPLIDSPPGNDCVLFLSVSIPEWVSFDIWWDARARGIHVNVNRPKIAVDPSRPFLPSTAL